MSKIEFLGVSCEVCVLEKLWEDVGLAEQEGSPAPASVSSQ